MSKKQTAVEWLIGKMKKPYADKHIMDILDQAKAMEKKQIIKAYEADRQEHENSNGSDYYFYTFQI